MTGGRGLRMTTGREQSDADCDPLTVECNHTSFRRRVAGEELGTSHGTTDCIMQFPTGCAREGNAACLALHIRFTEEGYSDVIHDFDSLLRLP